jgi:hypothetical protein
MMIAVVHMPDLTFMLILLLAFSSGAGSIGLYAYWRATHAARRLLDLLDELEVARSDLFVQQEEFKASGAADDPEIPS